MVLEVVTAVTGKMKVNATIQSAANGPVVLKTSLIIKNSTCGTSKLAESTFFAFSFTDKPECEE